MNIEKKYEKLLYWFKEISKVPRNSCKEQKIAEYICNFAKERKLEYRMDNNFNVLIKKEATKGYENKEAIIFQAHTDMVCEKTEYSTHDFNSDPIEIIENEDTYTAKDTTLGADDGIGVATLLLLLDDEEIKHPNIYCLFTTQEEIGMNGAKYFDYSGIDAKYLINVDGEEENTAIVGCAGGVRLCYEKEVKQTEIDECIYSLNITGLHGGHSGIDIDKRRINSNFLAAQIINKLDNVKIVSFIGGNKDNAIPNSTKVVFGTNSKNIKNVIDDVLRITEKTNEDKELKVELSKVNEDLIKGLSIEDSKELINLILNLKQGVIEYSKDVEGLVETSGNIGIVEVKDGKINITQLIRSSDDIKKEQIKEYNNSLAKKYGYSTQESSSYPGWKYKPNSNLEKVYIDAYMRVHNMEKPKICAIHAGVECGMIYNKLPNLEMISIGPDLANVHTTKETLYLKSCQRFLNTLLELIDELSANK